MLVFIGFCIICPISFIYWLISKRRNKQPKQSILQAYTCHGCTSTSAPQSTTMKWFLILLKYTPIFVAFSMIFNNIYYIIAPSLSYPLGSLIYLVDFLNGGCLLIYIFYFTASYTFGFCNWYRALITGEFLIIILAYANYIVANELLTPTLILSILFITLVISMILRFTLPRQTSQSHA